MTVLGAPTLAVDSSGCVLFTCARGHDREGAPDYCILWHATMHGSAGFQDFDREATTGGGRFTACVRYDCRAAQRTNPQPEMPDVRNCRIQLA